MKKGKGRKFLAGANIYLITVIIILSISLVVVLSPLNVTGEAGKGGGPNKEGGGGKTGLPQCLKEMNQRSLLVPYADYLTAHSNVLKAMNPCKIDSEVLTYFFDKLEEAEQTGQLPTAPIPSHYFEVDPQAALIINGGEESAEILGAKVAHILYIEVNGLVPWRLHDYDAIALRHLFKVCNVNDRCESSAAETGSFLGWNIIDHSPRDTWDLIGQKIDLSGLTTPEAAMSELYKHTRSFRHGGIFFDSTGNVVKQDNTGVVTMQQMSSERVSRHGCWSMSPYLIQLAAALNIPGEQIFEYYGPGHASAAFRTLDMVMAHGDDPYNSALRNTPSILLPDSYNYWNQNVLSFRDPGNMAYKNARQHGYDLRRENPSEWDMRRYCGLDFGTKSGFEHLETSFTDQYGTYATTPELSQMEQLILSKTNNCDNIPANNPDI